MDKEKHPKFQNRVYQCKVDIAQVTKGGYSDNQPISERKEYKKTLGYNIIY